jgi:hypothetical protein
MAVAIRNASVSIESGEFGRELTAGNALGPGAPYLVHAGCSADVGRIKPQDPPSNNEDGAPGTESVAAVALTLDEENPKTHPPTARVGHPQKGERQEGSAFAPFEK